MDLSDSQHRFLKGVRFAVVSTIDSRGRPHQTVMWYELNGAELLLSTPRDSLKHRHLKRDPRLSVCVEDNYTYLTLTGTATLDEDARRARADYVRLQKRYRPTIARLMIGFLLSSAVSRLTRIFRPRPPEEPGGNNIRDLLTRERVTLHMQIQKVYGSAPG